MKTLIKLVISVTIIAALSLAITGCGSGSSSGNRSTKSKTTVKTAGLLAGETLGSIQLSISFPYGVYVRLDPISNEPAIDVVQLIGVTNPTINNQGNIYSATYKGVKYVAATPSSAGSLSFQIFNVNGFDALQYIAIQLDITQGYFPKEDDFHVSDLAVSGIVNYGLTLIPDTAIIKTVEII